jgi:hypothetical protein
MYRVGGASGLEPMGILNLPVANCVSPAVADGRLIVRTLDAVYCYELRKDFASAGPAPDMPLLVETALSADEGLAAAALAACVTYADAAIPALSPAVERELRARNVPRFVGLAAVAAALGTNAVSPLVELLASSAGGRSREPAALACSLLPKVWPQVSLESWRSRLLKVLVNAAKSLDRDVASAALRALGELGPAAAAVEEELQTGVAYDLADELAAALAKIQAKRQDAAGKPTDAPKPTKPATPEITLPTLDL